MNALEIGDWLNRIVLPPAPTRADLLAWCAAREALTHEVRCMQPIPVLDWPADLAGGLHLRGYAARWTPDRRGECRQRGDFTDSLHAYRCAGGPLTLGHASAYPLGRVLDVREDDDGLAIEALVFPALNEDHQTVIDALTVGLIGALSFQGFALNPRHVILNEVCVTRTPAHPDAIITMARPL